MVPKTTIALMICQYLCLTVLAGCMNRQSLTDRETALHVESLTHYPHPSRWEQVIRAMEEKDRQNPPPQHATLFVGSSSIFRWNTQKWFPDIASINHGFNGSYIVDSWYYADRIIIPPHPDTIVFYAGDNDISADKSPDMVCADFKALVIRIRQALPKTKIIFIAIKPSIARWNLWPRMQQANELVKTYCRSQKDMAFIDMSAVMLDASGKPIRELFVSDGLHMNEKGYQRWTELLGPLITVQAR